MLGAAGLRLGVTALAGGLAATPALAGTYTTIYQFMGGRDGWAPASSPSFDEKGDLYGVTSAGGICPNGGVYGCGEVYKRSASGQQTTLFSFDGADGEVPQAPLTLVDHKLYGSALEGGVKNQGVLFSLHTDGTHFRLLHQFHGTDGNQPKTALVPGPAGAFYGVAGSGGPGFPRSFAAGVLFELLPDGTYVRLHDFTDGTDGGGPNALIMDASGTLYGSTAGGSPCNGESACGVVFEYVPSTASFTVLQQFGKREDPVIGSIGPDGTLYGVTVGGGTRDAGTLFKLVPSGASYSLTTLYSFQPHLSTGYGPSGGPILTRYGGLIGTTTSNPTLYRFKDNKMQVLYTFPTTSYPAPPTLDKNGTIYGGSASGGVTPCQGVAYTSCGYLYSFLQ